MTLAPDDIQTQQFRIGFRGYDVKQVDAFLDRVHDELLRQTADRAPEEGGAPPGATSPDGEPAAEQFAEAEAGHAARALRTLLRAEEMAEQVLADATAEADRIRLRAQAEGEQLLADAGAEKARVEAELQLRRERDIGALVLRRQQLQAEADRLADLERRYRESLQAWLAEHQRLLEQRLPVVDEVLATEERTVPGNGHIPVH
jgi:cell division initiation protein